ncbi:MAG TPA: hypothetical protein VL854_06115 [Nitrososphaeraceae archaeon]|nr:hypothetical protein [Nitrososphaeraceae archaeon]
MTLTEWWDDRFNYVHRSKIIRKILELQHRYESEKQMEDKSGERKMVWSEADLTYLQISILEDLLY